MQNPLAPILDTFDALRAPADERPLVRAKRRFVKISEGLDYDQERAFAISLIRNSKKLQECTQESIVDSFIQAGACDLTLNPTLQHAYLIPYFNKDMKVRQCQLAPGYRGLVWIAEDCGAIKAVGAEIVHVPDQFEYRGPTEVPLHRIDVLKVRNYENAVGVYVVAQLTGGGLVSSWMDKEAILRCRKMSERPNSIMWNPGSLWTEGWKKTAIRRAYKLWPKVLKEDVRASRVIEYMNEHEGIDQPRLVSSQPAGEVIDRFTEEQINKCHSYLTDKGWSDANASRQLARLANAFGATTLVEIPRAMFDKVFERLERGVSESGGPPA